MKGLLTLKQRPSQWSVLEISVRSQGGLRRTIITILQDDTDKNHPARGPSQSRGVIICVYLLNKCMRPHFIFMNDWIHFQNTDSLHVPCVLSNFLKPLSISKMRCLDTDTRVTRSRTYLEWASLNVRLIKCCATPITGSLADEAMCHDSIELTAHVFMLRVSTSWLLFVNIHDEAIVKNVNKP